MGDTMTVTHGRDVTITLKVSDFRFHAIFLLIFFFSNRLVCMPRFIPLRCSLFSRTIIKYNIIWMLVFVYSAHILLKNPLQTQIVYIYIYHCIIIFLKMYDVVLYFIHQKRYSNLSIYKTLC